MLLSAQPVTELPRKTWTRAELETLEAAGHLAGCRYELIEGEVFDKMGQNPRHAAAIARLTELFARLFAGRVSVQLPVEAAAEDATRSLPEPDIAVLAEPRSPNRHPGAQDVLLLVEVADTTIYMDTRRKKKLYARAGYPEYIVLDLNEPEMLVYRDPGNGGYRTVLELHPGDEYNPLSLPDARIPVGWLLTGE